MITIKGPIHDRRGIIHRLVRLVWRFRGLEELDSGVISGNDDRKVLWGWDGGLVGVWKSVGEEAVDTVGCESLFEDVDFLGGDDCDWWAVVVEEEVFREFECRYCGGGVKKIEGICSGCNVYSFSCRVEATSHQPIFAYRWVYTIRESLQLPNICFRLNPGNLPNIHSIFTNGHFTCCWPACPNIVNFVVWINELENIEVATNLCEEILAIGTYVSIS